MGEEMKRAILFPGQGSQKVGMGKELAAAFASARMVFEEVDNALNQCLSQLMFTGPYDELMMTENAQPAIMACSMATLRALEKEMGFRPAAFASFFAGHSVGEYSALCAARSISLADTARLVKLRGREMQKAVPQGVGSMAAVMGFTSEQVQKVIDETGVGDDCVIANDNSPEQVVVSGRREAVELVNEAMKTAGAKRTHILPVSAPFHCPLMKSVAAVMSEALENTQINVPTHPIVSNVTAGPVSKVGEIRDRLVEQVFGRVRWRESVQFMAKEGVTLGVELGTGNVLAGLVKRTTPSLKVFSAGTPKEMEEMERNVDWSVSAVPVSEASEG
jgi:[acyl-carrier-protein] S-malonyltransferase